MRAGTCSGQRNFRCGDMIGGDNIGRRFRLEEALVSLTETLSPPLRSRRVLETDFVFEAGRTALGSTGTVGMVEALVETSETDTLGEASDLSEISGDGTLGGVLAEAEGLGEALELAEPLEAISGREEE